MRIQSIKVSIFEVLRADLFQTTRVGTEIAKTLVGMGIVNGDVIG